MLMITTELPAKKLLKVEKELLFQFTLFYGIVINLIAFFSLEQKIIILVGQTLNFRRPIVPYL